MYCWIIMPSPAISASLNWERSSALKAASIVRKSNAALSAKRTASASRGESARSASGRWICAIVSSSSPSRVADACRANSQVSHWLSAAILRRASSLMREGTIPWVWPGVKNAK